ncbi:MAG TPA: hydroxyacid dehydrogenase [Puia sp.]|jgi:D-3-phosphoglycerate dehydrogenase
MKGLPKVFISEPINPKGMEMLRGKVQVILAPDPGKKTVLSLIGEADAAILRATTVFDQEVISAGVNLKAIVRTGIGVDNVDLKFAGENGIYVCNTPGTNDQTVAEHVVAVIMAFAKQIIFMDRAVRSQKWKERFSPNQMDVRNKKVGIIGYGNIGQATAGFCRCLGMEVTAYDPFIDRSGLETSFTEDLATIFSESDFVSLHCPSTPLTHKLVDSRYLNLMKSSAFLINTSRGDLVDEPSLVRALEERRIAGAALDVFRNEPLAADNPLLAFPNVILSPHIAGSTKESNERIAIAAVQAVMDTINGKSPLNICNLQYFSAAQKRKSFS